MTLIECVPNFSEGRNHATVESIAAAVSRCPGARLLDTTADPDHNRSVFTFTGPPQAIADAALAAISTAIQTIDLNRQTGVHPRIGAADVVPFVPLHSITLTECATLAQATGRRIWEELHLPVYLYEAAALRPECRRLENVRKLAPHGLEPDWGHGRHPTAGACVVGARGVLTAWNINLQTTDLTAARAIAREIRESSGGFPAVKALGLPLQSRGQVQVSINLTDFTITPLHQIFNAVETLSHQRGIQIAGSELIGMIHPAALAASAGHDLRWENLTPARILPL